MSNHETDLKRAIRKAWNATGGWCVNVPRGVFRGASGGYVHVAEDGFPDLLSLSPFGGLEVKVGNAKLRETQVAFRQRAERHGIRYARVDSVAGAVDVLRRWRAEDTALQALRRDREALERSGLA